MKTVKMISENVFAVAAAVGFGLMYDMLDTILL